MRWCRAFRGSSPCCARGAARSYGSRCMAPATQTCALQSPDTRCQLRRHAFAYAASQVLRCRTKMRLRAIYAHATDFRAARFVRIFSFFQLRCFSSYFHDFLFSLFMPLIIFRHIFATPFFAPLRRYYFAMPDTPTLISPCLLLMFRFHAIFSVAIYAIYAYAALPLRAMRYFEPIMAATR